MYKIVLCGNPDFVLKFFDIYLQSEEFEVIGVIIKESRGRDSDLAKWAIANELPLFRVKNINKDESVIKILQECDLCLVFAFGQIISSNLLEMTLWLNIHPSDLPLLRGPSPIQAALLYGYRQSALTLMCMDKKMDEGEIIAQKHFVLNRYHNLYAVFYELTLWGPEWILENILYFLQTGYSVEQDHKKATYCYLIKKEDHNIVKQEDIHEVLRKIRALGFVYLNYGSFSFKCFIAKPYEHGDAINIGGIAPIFIQLAGKKIMHIRNFMNGYLINR